MTKLALFPDLPTSSFPSLLVYKNWTVGRPKNAWDYGWTQTSAL